MKKLLAILGVAGLTLVLIALLLPGCAKPAAPEEKYITIGHSGPKSGFAATWGIYCWRSLELTADKYNESGGLDIKGEKYLIKLISYDDKYNATEGQVIANRLIYEDKVDIYTVFSGGAATAAADVTNEAGRFQLGTSWAVDEPNPEHPLAFARNIRQPEITPAAIAWLAEQYPQIKKAVKIGPNNPYGKLAGKLLKYCGPKAGWEVVAAELYEEGTVDFIPILIKLLALKPDLIDVTANPPDSAAQVIKQAKELGYTGMFCHWTGCNFEIGVAIVGAEVMEGVISGIEYGEPYTEGQEALKERYLEKYGPPWISGTLQQHPGNEILFQAIEMAGTWETEALVQAFRTGEFETIAGKAHYGGNTFYGIDNALFHDVHIAIAKGGKGVRLATIEASERNYPPPEAVR